jgi:hypothetical protein
MLGNEILGFIREDVLSRERSVHPLWVRMPGVKQRLEGLAATSILDLIKDGSVKSVLLQKPGATRHIRLIYLPSLRAHLEELYREQESKKCAKK